MGRWSTFVAGEFLAWSNLPSSLRWLDVACGTGALTATIAERVRPAALTGIDTSEGFLAKARERLQGNAAFRVADADSLPFEDAAVDVVVSCLMINFVPDHVLAIAEMRRVVRTGGKVAAYVWDYAGRMELMRHFWDSAVALDPRAHELDEGVRIPLCHQVASHAHFNRRGGIVDKGAEAIK